MNSHFHLRFDVRKVQDYIFNVPNLKHMLGANSSIGELFAKDFVEIMPETDSLFTSLLEKRPKELSEGPPKELKYLFKRNILSSSGGHFEAIFETEGAMHGFIRRALNLIKERTPGLEFSMSYREFDPSITLSYAEFSKITPEPLNTPDSEGPFIDAPFYELCQFDGQSTGIGTHKDNNGRNPKIHGTIEKLMRDQAEKFYSGKASDAIAKFYHKHKLDGRIPKDLEELNGLGKSPQDNMLAYIKADGNATGARFSKDREGFQDKSVWEAFVGIEEFWHENRQNMAKLLENALRDYMGDDKGKVPFILLMFGGDDLFMVTTPEVALDIACRLADPEAAISVSVGVAFTKWSYPVAQANDLAESCLESAKAAGYAQKCNDSKSKDGKSNDSKSKDSKSKDSEYIIPHIDWHVHFDSVYDNLKDIRRSSYMLSYEDDGEPMIEILCQRPYQSDEVKDILKLVKQTAKELDKEDSGVARNKIKSYRSALKNGYRDLKYLRDRLGIEDSKYLAELLEYKKPCGGVRTDSSLDKIELIEFYRNKANKEAKGEKD